MSSRLVTTNLFSFGGKNKFIASSEAKKRPHYRDFFFFFGLSKSYLDVRAKCDQNT